MGGRGPSERVVAISWNEWSRSIGIAGRDQPVRALERATDIRIIQALLGHDKLETTARYTRVATGMIANVTSPLDLLSQPAKKVRKRKGLPPA
jgi:integrase